VSLTVPFMSLTPGEDAPDVREAIDRVLARGWFILGPELEAFEEEFAAASGARHAIGVGTGTDAIALMLRGLGVGPGDEVITSPLSAAFSALAIMMAGATPVFADIDPDRLTLDPDAAAAAITPRTRALLPVHLYGQAADMPAFERLASRHNLVIVEDACQAHLATSAERPVGAFGAGAAFSFYPTKNLGALGDGGAIVTNDAALAGKLKRLRNGGQADKYRHVEFGVNSRLDEIQAAILRARLARLPEWTTRRRAVAAEYRRALAGAAVIVPPECDPGHVYHLFPVLVDDAARSAGLKSRPTTDDVTAQSAGLKSRPTPAGESRPTTDRDAFQRHLAAHGVGTLVHYPIAIPRQPAFAAAADVDVPIAERVAATVCSLPCHPSLRPDDIQLVADAVHAWEHSH
jgi:dTDP-3-amino-3,4,6-trideoxy-alpha-D-glucose transaminase